MCCSACYFIMQVHMYVCVCVCIIITLSSLLHHDILLYTYICISCIQTTWRHDYCVFHYHVNIGERSLRYVFQTKAFSHTLQHLCIYMYTHVHAMCFYANVNFIHMYIRMSSSVLSTYTHNSTYLHFYQLDH